MNLLSQKKNLSLLSISGILCTFTEVVKHPVPVYGHWEFLVHKACTMALLLSWLSYIYHFVVWGAWISNKIGCQEPEIYIPFCSKEWACIVKINSDICGKIVKVVMSHHLDHHQDGEDGEVWWCHKRKWHQHTFRWRSLPFAVTFTTLPEISPFCFYSVW